MKLTFLGDVYLPQVFDARGLEIENIVLNLEAPVTKSARPHPGKINLRVPDLFADATFGIQPRAVCLANNHIMDYGPRGLEDTLQALSSAGIAYFGAGTLQDDCNNPAIVRVGDTVVGLLGYVCRSTAPVFASGDAPGVAPIDLGAIRADIDRTIGMGAQRVVVCLHWGAEEVPLPRPEDVVLARRIVEAGADVIIGHHAHTVQSWEVHEGKPIFYGLGNFIMPEFRLPVRYTADGVATSWFSAVQGPWNQRSLAIAYDPASGDVQPTEVRFDGKAVRRSGRRVLPARDLMGRSYGYRFRFAFAASKLRHTLFKGARQPQLPRWRHVKSLIRHLTTRDFR